jgi:hypothetical protein
MRFFTRRAQQEQQRYGLAKASIIGVFIGLTPLFAFWLDWRLGLVIAGAYAALALAVWRVSRRR